MNFLQEFFRDSEPSRLFYSRKLNRTGFLIYILIGIIYDFPDKSRVFHSVLGQITL